MSVHYPSLPFKKLHYYFTPKNQFCKYLFYFLQKIVSGKTKFPGNTSEFLKLLKAFF